MRRIPIVGLCLLISLATASISLASDKKGKVTEPQAKPSLLSEFRFGFSAQDPWGPESGSMTAVGELLFAKPFTPADLFASYFVPRPHFGGSLNFDGRTSFAYAGLTWTVDVTPRVFLEASLGGAIHNGNTNRLTLGPNEAALGCSTLFRESGSVGVRLSAQWSLVATVEHLTNGGACSENRGLTNVGARIGYSF